MRRSPPPGLLRNPTSPRTRGEVKNKASGVDADADRARHAGAAKPAIAGRILGQILLMIVLGKIELAGWRNLGGDRADTFCGKRVLIHRLRSLRRFMLRVIEGVDRRTILGADVIALAH